MKWFILLGLVIGLAKGLQLEDQQVVEVDLVEGPAYDQIRNLVDADDDRSSSEEEEEDDYDDRPRPSRQCCLPKQWEGDHGAMMGVHLVGAPQAKGFGSMTRVHYCAIGQKVAAEKRSKMGRIRMLADFRGRRFFVDVNGNCTVAPLDRPWRNHCVPDSAKRLGRSFFGVGHRRLSFETYMMNINSRFAQATLTFSMTPRMCVPVGNSAMGTVTKRGKRVEFVSAGGYTDMNLGIRDRSVFEPPRNCRPKQFMDFEDLPEDHIMFLEQLTQMETDEKIQEVEEK